MGVLILLGLLFVAMYIAARILWKAGFYAGQDHEAVMWLASFDKLFVPNWQSLPIDDDGDLTPEQLKFANQVYAAAYRAALEQIKLDIVTIRREALEKFTTSEQGDGV